MVALATCAEVPEGDEDAPALNAALLARGLEPAWTVWDAPGVDWARFDLVVVRSTWDYAERRDEFLAWARSLTWSAAGQSPPARGGGGSLSAPRVLNPVPVLEWNTDKRRYLTDLERAGVPIVPTAFLEPGDPFSPPDEPFVVKPAISAGGRSSARFEPGEAKAAEALVRRIHSGGRAAMVQPYLGDVAETSLVYIGGAYSHAVRRRVPLPRAGERAVLYLDEELGPCEPAPAEREIATAALAASPGELLYARVDVARGAVLELELTEPSLYLGYGDGAAGRFAQAIAAAPGRRRATRR